MTINPVVAGHAPSRTNWPEIFGVPVNQTEQNSTPEQSASEDQLEGQYFEYDIGSLILRGIISDGLGGGTSIIETEDGQLLVSQGSILPDGARVSRILTESVEIEVEGFYYTLTFDTAAFAQQESFVAENSVSMAPGYVSELSLFSDSEEIFDSGFTHENFGRTQIQERIASGG